MTNATRESYLTLLADALKANVEGCRGLESPDSDLVYRDFEDIALEFEYEAFTKNTVITMYRRGVVKHLNDIKKMTKDRKLVPQLKTHVPKKRTARGGEFRAIVEEMREKYGSEFVAGFEKEQKPKVAKERNKTGNFTKESSNQTMIEKFFKKVNIEHEKSTQETKEIEIDDEITVLEPVTEVVDLEKSHNDKHDEIKMETTESNASESEENVPKVTETSIKIDSKPTNEHLKRKHSNLFGDSSDEESIPPKVVKNGTSETPTTFFKPPRIAYDRIPKAVSPKPVTSMALVTSVNDECVPKPPKLKPANAISKVDKKEKDEKTKSDFQTSKKSVSDIVIKYLMPYYKSKVITNKELFKAFARTISHKFYDKEYDDNIIKGYIDKHIANKGKIERLEDLT